MAYRAGRAAPVPPRQRAAAPRRLRAAGAAAATSGVARRLCGSRAAARLRLAQRHLASYAAVVPSLACDSSSDASRSCRPRPRLEERRLGYVAVVLPLACHSSRGAPVVAARQ